MYGMVYLVQALSPPLVQIEVLVMAAERGLQEIWDGFTNEGVRRGYCCIFMFWILCTYYNHNNTTRVLCMHINSMSFHI